MIIIVVDCFEKEIENICMIRQSITKTLVRRFRDLKTIVKTLMVFSLCPNKLLLVFLYFNMGYILTWVLALSYNSQAKIKPHIHCNYINSLLGLVATFLECDRLKKLILNVCSRGL